ncbi:hypothetical protein ABG957_07810, partial [Eggerthella lenta]|uniref:hypothetical protein n=1 Tax=Eggerthella lenta TaxID=84112 RepID=UPI00325B8F5A
EQRDYHHQRAGRLKQAQHIALEYAQNVTHCPSDPSHRSLENNPNNDTSSVDTPSAPIDDPTPSVNRTPRHVRPRTRSTKNAKACDVEQATGEPPVCGATGMATPQVRLEPRYAGIMGLASARYDQRPMTERALAP